MKSFVANQAKTKLQHIGIKFQINSNEMDMIANFLKKKNEERGRLLREYLDHSNGDTN